MSGVTVRDEDWTNSPKRYTGMNAAPISWASGGMKVKYETLDSGEREQYDSGMERDVDDDKTDWDLLVPENHPGTPMLDRWAELLTRGKQKYSERNWELAESEEEYKRFRKSAIRHFRKWWRGDTDEDHAAAVFFNIEGAEYVKAKLNDSR